MTLAVRRNETARAVVAQRQSTAALALHTPRLAKRIQRTFEKLRDSFIHGEAKAAGDDLALTYSTPDYDAFAREMHQILQTEYINLGTLAVQGIESQLGITIAFSLNERIIRRADLANRVKGITDDTREALRNTITNGIDDGLHPSAIARNLRDQLNGWAGLEDLTRSRAYTIARTETANAYNLGAVEGYRQSGIVRQVRVIDAPDCGWTSHNDPDLANGKIVTLDVAQAHPIAHPNCVRAFAAVAAGLEKPTQGSQSFRDAVDPGDGYAAVRARAEAGPHGHDTEWSNMLATESILQDAGLPLQGAPSLIERADYFVRDPEAGREARIAYVARDSEGYPTSLLEVRRLDPNDLSSVETTWRWTRSDKRRVGLAGRIQQVAIEDGLDMRTSAEFATQSASAQAFNEAYFAGRAKIADLPYRR